MSGQGSNNIDMPTIITAVPKNRPRFGFDLRSLNNMINPNKTSPPPMSVFAMCLIPLSYTKELSIILSNNWLNVKPTI